MSGIGKLTCLQELRTFTVGKNEGRKLAELKRLQELKGTLRINSLNNASTKEEALEANLNKKEGIRKLVLAWECVFDDLFPPHAIPEMAEEVFEGLCPPPYIEELSIENYVGVESPTWMMPVNCCLSVLQSLTLSYCLKWKVLPPLGQLPLLRHLKIDGAYAVEEIDSSFYGSGVAKPFQCLETLEFTDMPEWVVLSGVKEHTDFPRLCKLTVLGCPKLERVPMECLASVEVLETNCMALLAELKKLTSLKKLFLLSIGEMQLPTVKKLTSLKKLLSSLFTTKTVTKLPSLREITIADCDELVSVELKSFPSLKRLEIKLCKRIQSLSDLTSLKNITDLTSLKNITVWGCSQLHSLPLMPASLRHLYITDCPKLPRERYLKGGDDWHKVSHVRHIYWNGNDTRTVCGPATRALRLVHSCPVANPVRERQSVYHYRYWN